MSHLQRRNDSIRQMAMTLGLTREQIYWTLNDTIFLKENKNKLSYQEIADNIGKSKKAVAHKIAYMSAESQFDELPLDSNVSYYPTKALEFKKMLQAMEVGQSFEYPVSERQTVHNQSRLFPDKLFRSKLMTETTRRIWRLL